MRRATTLVLCRRWVRSSLFRRLGTRCGRARGRHFHSCVRRQFHHRHVLVHRRQLPVTCLFLDFDTSDAITQTYAVYGLVYSNVESTSVSFTDVDVAEGEYTLDWNCAGSGEQWGTGVRGGSVAQVSVTVVTTCRRAGS